MALVKQLSPGTQGFIYSAHSSPAQGQKPIGLAQALTIVRARYPEGRVDWLSPAVKRGSMSSVSVMYPGLVTLVGD